MTRVQSWVSPKSVVLADLDEPGAGGLLVGRPARRPRGCPAACRPSARCRAPSPTIFGFDAREEVDHPRRAERDLPDRLGRADGERAEEVLGAAHDGDASSDSHGAVMTEFTCDRHRSGAARDGTRGRCGGALGAGGRDLGADGDARQVTALLRRSGHQVGPHVVQPPVIRWFGRVLAALLILVGLAWAAENWCGARAWEAYVTQAKAAGEWFEPGDLILPAIPDEENFAAIPLFKPLLDYTMAPSPSGVGGTPVWRDQAEKERLEKIKVTGSGSFENQTSWRKGEFCDLTAWQQFYRKQEEFSLTGEAGSPGADVLQAL